MYKQVPLFMVGLAGLHESAARASGAPCSNNLNLPWETLTQKKPHTDAFGAKKVGLHVHLLTSSTPLLGGVVDPFRWASPTVTLLKVSQNLLY